MTGQRRYETVVFSSVYTEVQELLFDESPVLIQGVLQKEESSVKVLADKIVAMDDAEENWTASIRFNLDITRTDKDGLSGLHEILLKHAGNCPAYINLLDPDKSNIRIALPDQLRLKPGSSLANEVTELMGYPVMETVCEAVSANNENPRAKYNSVNQKARI